MAISLLVFLSLIHLTTGNVYVEASGSPYDSGSVTESVRSILFTTETHGIPVQTRVDYPAMQEEFAIIVFISGFGGLMPPAFYSDWLLQITSHGFVTLSLHFKNFDNGVSEIDETFNWLENNLVDHLNGTTVSWEHMGFTCHSAGCRELLDYLLPNTDPTLAKAVFMMEPFAYVSGDITLPVPIVLYGTNATCNVQGVDYIALYDKWQYSKIRLGNNMFGHCDFLDELFVPACRVICSGGGPMDLLTLYRRTTQGMVSSLFINILQGREDVINYLLDPSLIPLTPTDHDISQWT